MAIHVCEYNFACFWGNFWFKDTSKSSVFYVSAEEYIEEVADILGCSIEIFLATYLGLPLGDKRCDVSMWQGVVNKRERKLSA